MKKLTQKERILLRLKEARGQWVNYRVFNREMGITQAHARIFELIREGHNIKASDTTDEYGFKSYRLVSPFNSAEKFIEERGLKKPSSLDKCCDSYKIFNVHARDCETVTSKKQEISTPLF